MFSAILVICLCFLPLRIEKITAVSTYYPRTTAPNYTDEYYFSNNNPYYPGLAPYPGYLNSKGNCTWYAWGRAYEILGYRPSLAPKSAGNWYNNTADGYQRNNSTPKLGSIMCWDNHVAVVEKINGNMITLSESSYENGAGFLFRTSTDTLANHKYNYYRGNFQGFIYLGDYSNINKPGAPMNLKVNTNMTNITANWQPSSSATTYIVKIYNHYTCSGNDIVFNRDVGNVTSASFKLNPGHYWGFVHAWNEAGQSEGSNCVEFEVVDKISSPIPAVVKGYSGLYNGKSHTISISSLPEGSTVYYRTNTNASWSRTKPVRTSAGTTTVYYKITNSKYANDLKGSSKIVIKKVMQSASVKSHSGTYDGNAKTISLTNVSPGSKIYYRTSTKGNWTTKKPTRTSAGTTKVYYKIVNSNCTSTKTGTSNIVIKKAAQKASVKSYNGTYDGKAKSIKISGAVSGSKIYYRTSSNGKWVTKKPTRTSAGTTKVYYKITNSNCISTKTGSANITIKKATQKASVKGYSGTYNGKAKTIKVTNVTPGSKVYYRTSNNGKWLTNKPTRTSAGTTKVYYKITNSNCVSTKTGSASITVKKATQKATVKSYNGIYDGKKHSITISNVAAGSKIYYRTSSKGKWSTTKPYRTSNGKTNVYYKIKKSNYNDVTGLVQITITSKLSINKTLVTLDAPNNITLKATVLSSKSSDRIIKWSSSNTSVAAVNSSGKVTAKNAGTAVITAKAGNGQLVKCTIRVNQKNAYIPNGLYTFASSDQKFALSVPASDATSGRRLNVWETYGGNDQNWYLYNIGNNKFILQSNLNRSLVMDVVHMDPNNIYTADETGNSNEGKVGLFTYTDPRAQEWVATKYYDGRVILRLASKQQYILARGGNSDTNGNTVYIFNGNPWNQTYWNLIKR